MKVLCLSHSEREFDLAGASINALNLRAARRRPPLTRKAIESFPGIEQAIPFVGGLTLWRLDEGAQRLDLLASYHPDYKVQSAVFAGDRLVVCGSDRLEVLDPEMQPVRVIRHPLLAGTHTIALDDEGGAWVTSAPANAALRFDCVSWELTRVLPMPSRYGKGPSLDGHLDLHRHFVPTDYQPTHVNGAFPASRDEVLVTLWKQGALVLLNTKGGRSREIATGFIGCHGGRPDGAGYYLTDSAGGQLVEVTAAGRIARRVSLASRWVHDILKLGAGVAVAAVGDRNAVEIFDVETGVTLFRRSCEPFGRTTMFVSLDEVSEAWSKSLAARAPETEETLAGDGQDLSRPEFGADELLPPLHNVTGWMPQLDIVEGYPLRLISRRRLTSEYLLLSRPVKLWSGRYNVRCRVDSAVGNISVGLLDADSDRWILSKPMADRLNDFERVIEVQDPLRVRFVVSAHNHEGPGPIEANLYWASIRHLY